MSEVTGEPTADRALRFEALREAVALARARKESMEAFSRYAGAGGRDQYDHQETRDHFRSRWVHACRRAARLVDRLAAEPGLTRPELAALVSLAGAILHADLVPLRERLQALP